MLELELRLAAKHVFRGKSSAWLRKEENLKTGDRADMGRSMLQPYAEKTEDISGGDVNAEVREGGGRGIGSSGCSGVNLQHGSLG